MQDDAQAERAAAELTRSLEARGVRVSYVPAIGHTHLAAYRSKSQGGQLIEIFRHAGVPVEPSRELILLAQVAGHQYSDQRGYRLPGYDIAAARFAAQLALNEDQILAILLEECLAWRLGRVMLELCGTTLPEYEIAMRDNLELYRRSLMVADDVLVEVAQWVDEKFA